MFKFSPSTLLFLARILLIAFAAGAVAVALAITHRDAPRDHRASGSYACPMHPEVQAAAPGDCPICKMELEPVHAAVEQHAAKPPVKYVCPMHPKVTSPKPGSCPECKMDLVPEKPRGDAPAAHHAHQHAAEPAAKYVCPMHPKVTAPEPGSCPECKMDLVPEEPHGAASPATAAESEQSSFTVTANAEMRHYEAIARVKRYPISKEMRVPAWMESGESGVALMYLDEIELLEAKEKGSFSALVPRSGDPAEGIEIELSDEPPTKWDRSTALVKFRVPAAAGFSPLETGSVKFATRLREGLVIQASAVLHSPQGPYALVATEGRRVLTKRPIEIGSVLYGYAALISGLREGEEVAATHAFFLDAERRRQNGAAQ